MAKPIDKVTGATLELLILNCTHRERNQADQGIRTNVQRIMHPRETFAYGAGSHGHLFDGPAQPDPDNEKAMTKWRAEIAIITTRERELFTAAERAKGMQEPLEAWRGDLKIREDRLLMSHLSPEDSPEAESYIREHQRFIRTCERARAELEM